MAWLVLAAVIAVPVAEIAVFIKTAQWIGLLPTVAAAIAAGMVGLALVRQQGFELVLRTRAQFERGEVPVAEAFDGLCLALAGGLLLLPGFLSDVLAILLLLPPVRAMLRATLVSHMPPSAHQGGPGQGGPGSRQGPQVIEAEYRVVDDDK